MDRAIDGPCSFSSDTELFYTEHLDFLKKGRFTRFECVCQHQWFGQDPDCFETLDREERGECTVKWKIVSRKVRGGVFRGGEDLFTQKGVLRGNILLFGLFFFNGGI